MSFDAPQSRNEAILQNMLGAENELEPPQSRVEGLLQQILEEGGGGGGDSSAVKYTEQSLTDAQKGQARANINASGNIVRETVSGATPSIAAVNNTFYKCGELTSLTITSSPEEGEFAIRFTSGSTATVVNTPENILLPDGFSIEANTIYELNVLDRALVYAAIGVTS